MCIICQKYRLDLRFDTFLTFLKNPKQKQNNAEVSKNFKMVLNSEKQIVMVSVTEKIIKQIVIMMGYNIFVSYFNFSISF